MRRIKSKTEESKTRRRNQLIVGGVLIFLMIFSTLGFAFGNGNSGESEGKKITYNGYEFVEKNGFWYSQIGDRVFIFRKNPEQIEMISTEVNPLSSYFGKSVYISSSNEIASTELANNLYYVASRIQGACMQGELCEDETLPVKTCEDNLIIISESEDVSIEQVDSCVFIRGPGERLVDLVDEFLFNSIGIR